ncbi:FAD-dependent oxidoreductase [uncultured Adlercreutzia sp.]|uniref:oxidoreductase n=1 Tax=uncultured Adlercreutzia sp. TaxID=875803 RepID=UPI002600E2EC|nr:FAD-dependent oxidoreductase [uncultured Adlercreutzia sp.]
MTQHNVSRRSFLRGAGLAALGAGVAGAGLAGCAPQTQTAASGGEELAATGAAGTDDDVIAQALLNPQDYEYRQSTTDFATLFSPWTFGSMEIKNRMVKSAAGSATYLAGYTDELRQYYVNFAQGGVGMIWVEGEAFAMPVDGSAVPQEAVDFFTSLTDELKSYGAHVGFQWAPFGVTPSELTVEAIKGIEAAGAALAAQLQAMGFEAIEINAAGFNQGEQFLSRFHNDRDDEYGASSIENRARFVVECIQEIKKACGNNFAVQVLIDLAEESDNLTNNPTLMDMDCDLTKPFSKATTVDEGIALAKQFEAAGADSMHLRLGPLSNHPCQFGSDLYFIVNGVEGATGFGTQFDFSRHFGGELIGDHSGAGMTLAMVKRYKEALSIPCGAVTYMDPAHAPDFFEGALADGMVDFYLMTRPLTVDPEYVNKLAAGRTDEIMPCTRCFHCHIGSNEMNAAMGCCRVNALTQRVMREGGPATYELEPAATPKKVLVAGGGPAGMEAARIAALRGHDVTLCEKKGSLGGLLSFASQIKGPHENLDDYRDYLVRQCELAGVNVRCDTEVTADVVAQEAPDALVVACGAEREALQVPGGNVVALENYMNAEGDNVIVWGSSAQAFDMALWLTVHKKRVTIVTDGAVEDLDAQQSHHAQRFMTTSLYALGVRPYTNAAITSVADGVATVHSADCDCDFAIPCDAIVDAGTALPSNALAEAGIAETYVVGDASQPFNIALAVRAGNDAGRAI